MSFHFSFHAKTKKAALKALNFQQHVPADVKSFISLAIAGLPEDHAVHIKAAGHLTTEDDSYRGASAATIEVTPVYLYADEANPAEEPTVSAPVVDDVAA